MKLKLTRIFIVTLCFVFNESQSQSCFTVTCPSSFTAAATSSSCTALVNYSNPIVVNSCTASVVSQTFNFTGSTQTFVVPSGVSSLTIETWGAQGGANWVSNTNYGGYNKGTFTVTPTQTLQINAGGQPTTTAGGFNGGGSGDAAGKGGGGATDVRVSPYSLNDRIIVSGGGGGAGYWSSLHVVGGVGGGANGGDGYRAPDYATNPGGLGATTTTVGLNGTCSSLYNTTMAGSFGLGGNSGSTCGCEGYGGGGGWFGGAASGNCRGGGGGSGYVLPSATATSFSNGVTVGHGKVIITYSASAVTFTSSLASGLASGSQFPLGLTVQTFTVLASNSQTDACSFSVTVLDVTSPTIVCPTNTTVCSFASITLSNLAPINVADNCSSLPGVTYSLSGATSGSNTGSANTNYNLGITNVLYRATDAAGNSGTCSFTVTVNANPTITAISNQTLCLGNNFTLTPSGGTSYTVAQGLSLPASFTNSIVITPTAGLSIYTVTGTNSLSCSGSNTLSTLVNPNPNVTAVTSATNFICIGQSATLSATGAQTYTWSPAIPMSGVISPSTTTSYTVVGQDANGCQNTAVVTQSVDACAGISKNKNSNAIILIYPNPHNGVFTLELIQNAEIIIYSSLGQVVFQQKLNAGQTQVDLKEFANGIYVLKVKDGEASQNHRLIKN